RLLRDQMQQDETQVALVEHAPTAPAAPMMMIVIAPAVPAESKQLVHQAMMAAKVAAVMKMMEHAIPPIGSRYIGKSDISKI
ncbi:hypothetical protein, partial [Streptomyces turgidiscabies]|uniref:hypothetical protein n=1 Tax=Streptomyces turgidiscabies TaxID=85558 RepID=UPI0038F7BDBE